MLSFEEKNDWNIISEEEFKQRIHMIFNKVSSAIQKSLGPYGSNTIIEQFGQMHITKDGWQILKNINSNNSIDNNIKQLLINIAAQVVIKVGDGSSSSLVAANSLLILLDSDKELKKIRSRNFSDILSICVKMITDRILQSSTKITKDNDYQEIYQLAMIATNGDHILSDIIRKIYKETENPNIEFSPSKTSITSCEIIEGYRANITYLDSIFAENDIGICEIDNPLIIMFDHKIEKIHFDKIISKIIELGISTNRRVVVIAPHYDNLLLNHIKQTANIEFRKSGFCSTVYTRIALFNNLQQLFYNDFCMLTGGMLISENTLYDLEKENDGYISHYIGQVDKISIGPKTSIIKGFNSMKQSTYDVYLNDAITKLKEIEEVNQNLNIVNSQIYDLKQRVSKLKCKMGIINVGGNSSLMKTTNYDLVEDAVKACESAFKYGYNIGGNLIIPIVIDELLNEGIKFTDNEKKFFELLRQTFVEVFSKVIYNKFKGESTDFVVNDLINECIEKKECWNLIDDCFSKDIINSCQTDIEILKAVTSIVSLLLSSNQYISIMTSNREQ